MAPKSIQSAFPQARAAALPDVAPGGESPARDRRRPPAGAARAAAPDGAAAADRAALALRTALDGLVVPLARAACAFVRARGWAAFGHSRLDDHARERFGRSGRWVRDLAALGDAAASSPALVAALTGADGGRPLGRVAALLIARAGAHDAIDDWIARARRESVRDLRAAIRAGGEPGGAVDGGPHDGDPDGDRVLFRVPVPLPVLVAFDEALDLYRAVEGRDASVTSFVEALIGEARAAHPAETAPFVSPLLHGRDPATVEGALRRSTSAWRALPPPAAGGGAALPGIGRSLRALGDLEGAAGQGDEQELDRQIRALIGLENDLELRLSALLAEMGERGMWATLGFASVGHYAEERLGLSRSRTGERVRLARALRGVPRLAAACGRGELSAEAAAIIQRLVGDEGGIRLSAGEVTEEAWIRHAATATVKRLREEARAIGRYRVRVRRAVTGGVPAGLRPGTGGPSGAGPSGDGPADAGASGDGSTDAGASGDGSTDAGAAGGAVMPLDDRAWHASLRREPGTATARILEMGRRSAGVDPRTVAAGAEGGSASRPARAPEPDVFQRPPDVFRLLPLQPDVFLRLRLPGEIAIDLVAALEAARSDLEAAAAASPWDAPWPIANPTPAQIVARVEFIRGRRLPAWVGLLALLEDFALTWDHDAGAPAGRDDSIFIRDGWRCAAPGCTSRRHLEDHHVVYRSRGGGHGHANRVTLCRFHHQRGEHGGLMSVRGEAPLGLTWRLGRPAVAVLYRNERRLGAPAGATAVSR